MKYQVFKNDRAEIIGINLIAENEEDRKIINRFGEGGVKVNDYCHDKELQLTFKDLIGPIETAKIGELDCLVCGAKFPIKQVLSGSGTLMVKVNNELRLIPACPACKEPRCSECGGVVEIEYAGDYPDTSYCFSCKSRREIHI